MKEFLGCVLVSMLLGATIGAVVVTKNKEVAEYALYIVQKRTHPEYIYKLPIYSTISTQRVLDGRFMTYPMEGTQ